MQSPGNAYSQSIGHVEALVLFEGDSTVYRILLKSKWQLSCDRSVVTVFITRVRHVISKSSYSLISEIQRIHYDYQTFSRVQNSLSFSFHSHKKAVSGRNTGCNTDCNTDRNTSPSIRYKHYAKRREGRQKGEKSSFSIAIHYLM